MRYRTSVRARGRGVNRVVSLLSIRSFSYGRRWLVVTPFAPLATTDAAALAADARDVVRYLGGRGKPTPDAS